MARADGQQRTARRFSVGLLACLTLSSLHTPAFATEPAKRNVAEQLDIDAFMICALSPIKVPRDLGIPPRSLPNEADAILYGQEVFETVFGKAQTATELPLRAARVDDHSSEKPNLAKYNGDWIIGGSFNQPPGTKGGTALMIADPASGKILCLGHGM